VDAKQIHSWRKELRRERLQARSALPEEALRQFRQRIDAHLERAFGASVHGTVAFCWPYKNEYDARHLVARWRKRGLVSAMPVIAQANSPLIFRVWQPGLRLERGPLGIPYPVGTREVAPDVVLLPVLAFDAGGYRLGYGGGYFDRTLAALARRPLVIGLGYECQFIETIHPLEHDIPLDYMVTERGLYRRSGEVLRFEDVQGPGFSSPPCYASEIAPDYFGEFPDRKV